MHLLRNAARCVADRRRSLMRPCLLALSGVAACPPAVPMFGPRRTYASSFAPARQLMCYGGPCEYSEHDWEDVSSYIARNPILYKVSNDRLIEVNPDKPYMTTELGNVFLRSCILLSYISHIRGISICGLFKKETIGVLKNVGVLGLKDIKYKIHSAQLTETLRESDYIEVKNFLVDCLKEEYGEDIMKYLLEDLDDLFGLMGGVKSKKDEKLLVYHPSMLEKKARGIFMFDIHAILRREMALNMQSAQKAVAIMNWMPYCYFSRRNVVEWTTIVDQHPLLKFWIAKRKHQRGPKWKADGQGLIDIHRHGFVHAIEKNLLGHLMNLSKDSALSLIKKQSLDKNPHTVLEVIDLFHYAFPSYLHWVVNGFMKEGMLEKLNMRSRFSLPSSYK